MPRGTVVGQAGHPLLRGRLMNGMHCRVCVQLCVLSHLAGRTDPGTPGKAFPPPLLGLKITRQVLLFQVTSNLLPLMRERAVCRKERICQLWEAWQN